jgi:saccharopine dehydrogenase-like NADP-dependent oxidoreductase
MTAKALGVGVLGAGGTIAPAIVRDLAESDELAGLRLLDLDGERARRVAERHGLGRAEALEVDARDGLAKAIAGLDVLVNAASYRVNLDAMRACLEVGCQYLDLGGLYWLTGRQLELGAEFERAGLLAILGIGSSPGKTNVMAVRAVRELGGRARDLEVVAAGRDLGARAASPLSFPYALQTLVDEVTMRPVVVRDGRPLEIEPLSPGGVVDFGEPIGPAETIHTLHSELRTFPASFGCTEASFRLSLPPPVFERLRELASAPPSEVEAAAADALPPSARAVSVHVVEACDGERVVRVRAVTEPLERWGLGGGVVSTGAPAAAAVRLIARGRIDATGVHPPEACIEPDDLFGELERRGTTFEVEQREAVQREAARV